MDHRLHATASMAESFYHLFVNRRAYTRQSTRPHLETGIYYYYRPKARDGEAPLALSPETVQQRLAGGTTLGIYGINPRTQRSKWVAIDADYKNALVDLLKLQNELQHDGVEPALEKEVQPRRAPLDLLRPTGAGTRLRRVHLSLRIKTGAPDQGRRPARGARDPLATGRAGRGRIRERHSGATRGESRRAGKGWRFWFYGADYTLGDQLALFVPDSKNLGGSAGEFHRRQDSARRVCPALQTARSAQALLLVASQGISDPRLYSGAEAGTSRADVADSPEKGRWAYDVYYESIFELGAKKAAAEKVRARNRI